MHWYNYSVMWTSNEEKGDRRMFKMEFVAVLMVLFTSSTCVLGQGFCQFDDSVYRGGQKWNDGCNDCTCLSGRAICTRRVCPPCVYNSQGFPPGQSRPADDGCNACICGTDGSWNCTENNCGFCQVSDSVYTEGQTWIDGCNDCTCLNGQEICTRRVCVPDIDPPVVSNCPDHISHIVEPFCVNYTGAVRWTEPTATDDCGLVQKTLQTHRPGDVFSGGSSRVRYIFEDCSGNRAECVFVVTGYSSDIDPPIVSNCPGPIQALWPFCGDYTSVIRWTEPIATDDCGLVQKTLQTHRPGDVFSFGRTTVRYIFEGCSGNRAKCMFDVILAPTFSDYTPPVITRCPYSFRVSAPAGSNSAIATWTEPTAIDVSGATLTHSRSHAPNSFFHVGTTIVTYMFVDECGYSATCTFEVMVSVSDIDPPIVSNCPGPIQYLESFTCDNTIAVNWTEPIATDDCGLVQKTLQTHRPGDVFSVGFTTVRYIFEDCSGNSAECMFEVLVPIVEYSSPMITSCPWDVQVTAPPGSNSAIATWTEPTGYDILGDTITRSRSHAPGSSFQVGTTTVTYRFSNRCDNTFCSFNVMVSSIDVDAIPPVITGCPSTVQVSAPAGSNRAIATWTEPTATDNTGVIPTRIRSHVPGSSFHVGTTSVTYIFFDRSGTSVICKFYVVVTSIDDDAIPPVITGCPSTVQVSAPAGSNRAIATWTEPTATDNTGVIPTRIRSHVPGSSFHVGTTSVTYIFFDRSGNSASCQFNVMVSFVHTAGSGGGINPDNVHPCISKPCMDGQTCIFNNTNFKCIPNAPNCPSNIERIITPPATTTRVTWTPPTATTPSGITLDRIGNHNPGDTFNLGITSISYSFVLIDINHRFVGAGLDAFHATCTFLVTVQSLCGDTLCSLRHSTCMEMSEDIYACVCDEGYEGANCLPVNNPCNSNPCMDGQVCFYSETNFICRPIPSSGRKRRGADDLCKSASCSPHTTCMEMSEDTYACICDEGYEAPDCFTAALQHDVDHDGDRFNVNEDGGETTMAIAEDLSVAIISALILVISIMVAIMCIASHRMKTNKKSAIAYRDTNEVNVPYV